MNTELTKLMLVDLRKRLKKKKTFKNKLNRKELQHLKETTNRGTLTELKRNLISQKKDNICCFVCKQIAKKLGLEA